MTPENRIPTHPGEILLEEFLKPMHLTQVLFAQHIGVPVQRINEIVNKRIYYDSKLPRNNSNIHRVLLWP